MGHKSFAPQQLGPFSIAVHADMIIIAVRQVFCRIRCSTGVTVLGCSGGPCYSCFLAFSYKNRTPSTCSTECSSRSPCPSLALRPAPAVHRPRRQFTPRRPLVRECRQAIAGCVIAAADDWRRLCLGAQTSLAGGQEERKQQSHPLIPSLESASKTLPYRFQSGTNTMDWPEHDTKKHDSDTTRSGGSVVPGP